MVVEGLHRSDPQPEPLRQEHRVGPKQSAGAPASFSSTEIADIGTISRNYLLENPEVIRDAIQALQAKEEAAKAGLQSEAVKEHKDALYADAGDPIAGNPQGDVTLVEFFDYKCPYCKQVTPALEALLKEDPNLKIVFKEFPILSDGSVLAARAALAAMKQDKYLPLHQALMAYRGALDLDTITSVATSVGLDAQKLLEDMKSEEIDKQLKATHPAVLVTLGGDYLSPSALGTAVVVAGAGVEAPPAHPRSTGPALP